MLSAVLLPWLVNIVVIFRVGPFGRFDATPIAFAVFAKLLLWGSERYALFDVVPVARDLVIEQMNDAGLLGPDLTLIHLCECSDTELSAMANNGVSACIGPHAPYVTRVGRMPTNPAAGPNDGRAGGLRAGSPPSPRARSPTARSAPPPGR